MRARRPRNVREGFVPQKPVKKSSQQYVPAEPGFTPFGIGRGEYEQALAARERDQHRLDQQYADEMAAYTKSVQRNQSRRDVLKDNNLREMQRNRMMRDLPESLRTNEAAKILSDRVIDAAHVARYARNTASDGMNSLREGLRQAANVHPGYYVGGASVIGSGALLNAYNDLQSEGLDSGVFPTVGRATSNALNGMGSILGMNQQPVGVDPLAAARNNIAVTQSELGSNRLLEALVMDAVDPQKPAVAEAAAANIDVEALIDAKAIELMQEPYIDARGNQRYMSPQDAYSKALQIFELDQKF